MGIEMDRRKEQPRQEISQSSTDSSGKGGKGNEAVDLAKAEMPKIDRSEAAREIAQKRNDELMK